MLLQSKLADTSMTFKDVLEIRTQVSFHVAQFALCLADYNHALEHEGVKGPHRTVHAFNISCC